MKRLLPILLFTISLLGSFHANADDIILSAGRNFAIAPTWKYKGGGTNLDGMPWKTLGYTETGWVSGKSALGFGASNPLKNTAIPTDNSAGGGGPSGARYPTLYFRNIVQVIDPSIYSSFQINARFDDGIVVWVNGQEAFRNNIAANPSYATLATAAISGNGSNIITGMINSSLFIPGNNIIAVEVHQSSLSSSDLFFDMELRAINSNLTRGPFLQVGNQSGVTVRWRTSTASDSKITWGTNFGIYPNIVSDATSSTEHILRITGLQPDTKYYYTIGAASDMISANRQNYFITAPATGSDRKFRIVAFGDCGNLSTNQFDVKDAFLNYMNGSNADAMILLGDNAYTTGIDLEFQTEFFDVYSDDILRFSKLYTAPGNHDYGNDQANAGVRNNAYYNSFSMPVAGECGGVPSGTAAYYSFDIGNIHFLSLDSYGVEDAALLTRIYDTTGAQVTWIKQDLAANTKRWTVAYFHHPPYTKAGHDADTEQELIDIRERFVRILERYGVDMVLCGHSHGYERSYLLKNFYRTPANPMMDSSFKFIYHTATGNNQNAKYNGTANSCAYKYNSGQYNHGSMYVVAGSAGQLLGAANTAAGYPYDAMYYSNVTGGGVFYFETDSNRLDAKFISYVAPNDPTPVLLDSFTIFKDVNKVQDIVVAKNSPLTLTASWRGTYLWPNNGSATTQAVNINTSTAGAFSYIVRDANNCLKDSFHVLVTPPLPVSVTSFTATLNKDIVLLDWETSQETNNKFFSIERSTDGNSFSLLGNINGAGTTSLQQNYHMLDMQPRDGINYYRLSQTDLDGQRRNIETKKIIYKGTREFKITVVNTGNGIINIAIHNTGTGPVQMNVIDMLGREVISRSFKSGSGNVNQSIQLQQGTYVLVLMNSNGQRLSTKIIVD